MFSLENGVYCCMRNDINITIDLYGNIVVYFLETRFDGHLYIPMCVKLVFLESKNAIFKNYWR